MKPSRVCTRSCRSLSSKVEASPREAILSAALSHVPAHGWTEQALAQAVVTSNLPPSYIGLVEDKKSELIHYFMIDCNERLRREISSDENQKKLSLLTHAQVIEWMVRTRLEMNIPFVKTNRWHEGMALGALPMNALETAGHLEKLVTIIEEAMSMSSSSSSSHQSLGQLERGALGAVYVSTELHLLQDTSVGYEQTWRFLNDRCQDLERAATSQLTSGYGSIAAGTAVASSLAGAAVSLIAPAARSGVQTVTGGILPTVMTMMQQVQPLSQFQSQAESMGAMTGTSAAGTRASDYDLSDLPPFETPTDVDSTSMASSDIKEEEEGKKIR